MKLKLILFIAFSFVSSLVVSGQSKLKAIKAGKMIDVVNGKVLENQIILINNNIIVDVGPSVIIPPGTEIIDLSNSVVLPGLIDCHTHLTGQPSGDYYGDKFRKTTLDFAIIAHLYAKKTLEAGFTSCRDVGSSEFLDIALRNAINEGQIPGPRLQVATMPIGSTGSHIDFNGFSPYLDWKISKQMSGIADGLDEVQKQVRYNIKYGADIIKLIAGAGVLSEEESAGAPQYSQEEMNAIVAEATRWGKKTCAHAHGTETIKMAIMAGVASVEHGSLIDEEGLQLMKKKGTYLIPTIYVGEYVVKEFPAMGFPQKIIDKAKEISSAASVSFSNAVKEGVKIAYGTDAAVFPHGDNAKQFVLMVKYGMTPMAAIQSATMNAADLLGWKEKTGSLTKGKFADIIAVAVDPLDDISTLEHVTFVMKDGIVYKNSK